jgi:hypothetical protein
VTWTSPPASSRSARSRRTRRPRRRRSSRSAASTSTRRARRSTTDNDLAHAIELLKRLATDEERAKAAVFMHGLSEMQREWRAKARKSTRAKKDRKPR